MYTVCSSKLKVFDKVCSRKTVQFECLNVLYKIDVNLEIGFVLLSQTNSFKSNKLSTCSWILFYGLLHHSFLNLNLR